MGLDKKTGSASSALPFSERELKFRIGPEVELAVSIPEREISHMVGVRIREELCHFGVPVSPLM